MEVVNVKPNVSYLILISSVAALGGLLFGFDSGVINGTVMALQNTFQSSSIGTGFSVASMLLGCALGAFCAGRAADTLGRKPTMLLTAIGFILSAWGSGIANSATMFTIYRLIGGVSVGAASVIAPAYISEVAPPQMRGRLASMQQLAIVIGLFAAFLSNYTIASWAGGAEGVFLLDMAAWRWMFWIEIIPAAMFFIGALVIPESPRYLVARGKSASAAKVFAKTLGQNVEATIQAVLKTVETSRKPELRDLLDPHTKKIRTVVWIGIVLSVFQQLVGINVVFYYGAVLWQAAGFGESQALFINLISGIVNIASTFVAIAYIDRSGRKPLLLLGSTGMAVALTVLSIVFGMAGTDSQGQLALSSSSGTLALVAAHLFVFSFGVSWGPVVWVMLGEMFNNQYRGAALAVGASAQWLANFLVTMTFPILLGSVGLTGAYGIYALSAILSLGFVIRYVHETKGMELEQMPV